jgi:3-oxoacyl-[acyl-carrier protein] reductase
MDLGLHGKRALVCGASKGLGLACADALAAEGVDVVIVARNAEALEKAARDLRARHGHRVVAVAADITKPEGRAAALDAVAGLGDLDILVNNAGGPPPRACGRAGPSGRRRPRCWPAPRRTGCATPPART